MRRLVLLSFLCSASCSDESPLALDTALNDMSDEQAREVCEYRARVYRRARGTLRDRCMVYAVRERSPTDCEATLQACLRASEGEGEGELVIGGAGGQAMQVLENWRIDCSEASAASWSYCDVTFGEFKQCLDAEAVEFLEYKKSLSCEQSGTVPGPFILVPTESPERPRLPQCQAVSERCVGE